MGHVYREDVLESFYEAANTICKVCWFAANSGKNPSDNAWRDETKCKVKGINECLCDNHALAPIVDDLLEGEIPTAKYLIKDFIDEYREALESLTKQTVSNLEAVLDDETKII